MTEAASHVVARPIDYSRDPVLEALPDEELRARIRVLADHQTAIRGKLRDHRAGTRSLTTDEVGRLGAAAEAVKHKLAPLNREVYQRTKAQKAAVAAAHHARMVERAAAVATHQAAQVGAGKRVQRLERFLAAAKELLPDSEVQRIWARATELAAHAPEEASVDVR